VSKGGGAILFFTSPFTLSLPKGSGCVAGGQDGCVAAQRLVGCNPRAIALKTIYKTCHYVFLFIFTGLPVTIFSK
jgi:hypothetical protein